MVLMSDFTTEQLKAIAAFGIDTIKEELEERLMIEDKNNFPFKTGDVIYTKCVDDNFLLKIKKIDKRNNNVVADEIILRDDGSFGFYNDEWYDIITTSCHEYTKIEDSEIFENLLKIINKYNDDLQQLFDDTYLKLKNEIAPYDN